MASLRRKEGYLQIDHRASPGLSAEDLRKIGREFVAVGEGQNYETAVVRCCHCGTQYILNPDRSRPRGYCRKCDDYVCDNPECNRECRPQDKLFDEAMEALARGQAPKLIIP